MFDTLSSYLRDKWTAFRHWVDRNIAQLEEAALKHRSAVILLSVMLLFIEPDVKLAFGSAALAGFGVSVNPPQTISISLVLIFLLIYRFLAFWVTILLASGTDKNIATGKALYQYDPAYDMSATPMSSMEEVIKDETETILYKWKFWKFVWEVLLPTTVALVAILVYTITYFLNAA